MRRIKIEKLEPVDDIKVLFSSGSRSSPLSSSRRELQDDVYVKVSGGVGFQTMEFPLTDNQLVLKEIQTFFPNVDMLKITFKDGTGRLLKHKDGFFKPPMTGWNSVEVEIVHDNFRKSNDFVSVVSGRNSCDLTLESPIDDFCHPIFTVDSICNIYGAKDLSHLLAMPSFVHLPTTREYLDYRDDALKYFAESIFKRTSTGFNMSFLFQIYEMKIGNYLECFVDIINGLKGCQTCLVGFENEINALSHAVSIEHAKKHWLMYKNEPIYISQVLSKGEQHNLFHHSLEHGIIQTWRNPDMIVPTITPFFSMPQLPDHMGFFDLPAIMPFTRHPHGNSEHRIRRNISRPTLSGVFPQSANFASGCSILPDLPRRPLYSSPEVLRLENNDSRAKKVLRKDTVQLKEVLKKQKRSEFENDEKGIASVYDENNEEIEEIIFDDIENEDSQNPSKEPTEEQIAKRFGVDYEKVLKLPAFKKPGNVYGIDKNFEKFKKLFFLTLRRTILKIPFGKFKSGCLWKLYEIIQSNYEVQRLIEGSHQKCNICPKNVHFTMRHLFTEQHIRLYQKKWEVDPPHILKIFKHITSKKVKICKVVTRF